MLQLHPLGQWTNYFFKNKYAIILIRLEKIDIKTNVNLKEIENITET